MGAKMVSPRFSRSPRDQTPRSAHCSPRSPRGTSLSPRGSRPTMELVTDNAMAVRGFGSELETLNGIYDEVLFHGGSSRCWHYACGDTGSIYLIEQNKHGMWCIKSCIPGSPRKHIIAWDASAQKRFGSAAETPDKVLAWKRRREPLSRLRSPRSDVSP